MSSDSWTCSRCYKVNEFKSQVCECGSLHTDPSNEERYQVAANEPSGRGIDPEKVLKLLEEKPGKGSWVKNLMYLVISLWLFYVLGVLEWGTEYLIAIIVAIFIHECGHLVAMKIFGYKNLKMLFIPFMGAIAAGVPEDEIRLIAQK